MNKTFSVLIALALAAATAHAKLPPPTDEAKAAAAAAKDKAAWSDKVAAYQLCLAQDKLAARYLKGNKDAKKPTETPACANPGPYVPPVPAVAAATPAAPAAAAPAAPAPAKK